MTDNLLPIGEVAEMFGIATSTLRYWEDRGLLRPATRRGGKRHYGSAEINRIAVVRIWQSTGQMSLDEIAAVLAGSRNSADWRAPVHSRIAAIDQAIEQLRTAKRFLEHTVTCPRDNPVDDCPHLRGEVEEHLAAQRARVGRRKPAGRGSE
ncbi:MerR family transcriptional regulator [Nocardia asiatica]|uniref:MerR family transcriptional regulator n=1 Tax=Nocardia asiatica TaxID=209252 RepID=UPI003EDE8C85